MLKNGPGRRLLFAGTLGLSVLAGVAANAADAGAPHNHGEPAARVFTIRGLVRGLQPADQTVTIQHDAIPDFMPAMTMPFKVKAPDELKGLKPGDEISFRLHVTENESWVDHLVKTGGHIPVAENPAAREKSAARPASSLLDYKFTNELGQAVSFNDFRGQALAVNFIYTRCPLPDYCPRLSKDFEEASGKLTAMSNAPANWHFISVTFDPAHDTPGVLKAYGRSYHYNPARWSFFTGPPDKIGELARAAGVNYQSENGLIQHNFRTLIIDASGHLQMVFPTSGNISEGIVDQIIKAAAVTNPMAAR